MAAVDIDTLVIDELAVCRHGGTDRTKVLRRLAARMKYVWGMTGAPIPNCPTDAWAQASIVTPNTVHKYFSRFREQLMNRQPGPPGAVWSKWVPKDDAVDQAFKALQPAVRYTLDDVVELPECIERTIDVELSDQQKLIYEQVRKKLYAAIAKGEITAVNAAAAMSKLLQISMGWVYTRTGETAVLDNNNRVQVLVDAVLGCAHKCLVFVPFKHALAGISKALTKEGIEHAVVSGDM